MTRCSHVEIFKKVDGNIRGGNFPGGGGFTRGEFNLLKFSGWEISGWKLSWYPQNATKIFWSYLKSLLKEKCRSFDFLKKQFWNNLAFTLNPSFKTSERRAKLHPKPRHLEIIHAKFPLKGHSYFLWHFSERKALKG